jgi:alginate O-acetyltransferase complex protein AlgI
MTTMLLGGLWHGASWNFVAWGGLHGVALTAHKAFAEVTSGIRKPLFMVALWTVCSWLLTQAFVLLTWIPFRAQNFSGTIDVLRAFAGIDDGGMRAKIPYLAILLPLAVDTFVVGMVISRLRLNDRVPAMGPLATALALGCITAVALASMPLLVKSFIYFQF